MQGRQTGSRTAASRIRRDERAMAEWVGAEWIWTVGSSRTTVAQLHRLRSVVSSCLEKQRGEIVREIEGEGEKTIGGEGKERCSLVVVVVAGRTDERPET